MDVTLFIIGSSEADALDNANTRGVFSSRRDALILASDDGLNVYEIPARLDELKMERVY
jgi:hypothetical protein